MEADGIDKEEGGGAIVAVAVAVGTCLGLCGDARVGCGTCHTPYEMRTSIGASR